MTDATYVLTGEERARATAVGTRRHEASRKKGRKHTAALVGDPEELIRLDVLGAMGELAAARILGLDWPAHVDTFHTEPDLYPHLEIRTVRRPTDRLIVREADPADRLYILVEETEAGFRIVGGLSGRMARRDEWWDAPADRPGAWFVPRDALKTVGRRAPSGNMAQVAEAPRRPANATIRPMWDELGAIAECHGCHERITDAITLTQAEPDSGRSHWRWHPEHAPPEQAEVRALAHALVDGAAGDAG